MPFSCNLVSLYSAVTRVILAYGCNETYCSILELFVYCNITNCITVVQRSVCLCVFFLFFQCNTTVIYGKLGDTATFYMQLAMLQIVSVFLDHCTLRENMC